MKLLLDGVWRTDVTDTPALRAQRLKINADKFNDWITQDGVGGFKAEPDRYHLYISYACPWAHRTVMVRALKKLEDVVSFSVLHPKWGGPDGWRFGGTPMSTIDHIGGRNRLYEVYQAADPHFTGKVTVPVLWDKKTGTIVNNESGDIVEMLNSSFDAWGDQTVDLFPHDIRSEIDQVSRAVVSNVSMGVYRAGFASTQAAYDDAVAALFQALDHFENRLELSGPYLHGDRLTVSDIHLFATLVRFDAVYHGALKCRYKRLIDYPALSRHTRDIFNLPGIAETVKIEHIERHYYDDLGLINPEIVPVSPAVDFRSGAPCA